MPRAVKTPMKPIFKKGIDVAPEANSAKPTAVLVARPETRETCIARRKPMLLGLKSGGSEFDVHMKEFESGGNSRTRLDFN